MERWDVIIFSQFLSSSAIITLIPLINYLLSLLSDLETKVFYFQFSRPLWSWFVTLRRLVAHTEQSRSKKIYAHGFALGFWFAKLFLHEQVATRQEETDPAGICREQQWKKVETAIGWSLRLRRGGFCARRALRTGGTRLESRHLLRSCRVSAS